MGWGFLGDAAGWVKDKAGGATDWYGDNVFLGGQKDSLFPDRGNNEFRTVDPNNQIGGQAGAAANFANQGERGYGQLGRDMQGVRSQLARQASGQDSISREQLRQGLGREQAMQQSMAASAAPANAAMAARTAAMQAGRNSAGMAGNAAMAGIAERQAANQQLGNMLLQQRAQELQAAQGSRGQALQGYGAIEAGRTQRFDALTRVPTQGEQMLGAAQGLGGFLAMSDKRLKEDIKKGDDDAAAFLDGLKSYTFRYKDGGKHGEGEQLGIMAQDLARSKHGRQAVVETKDGLAVHGAKLATALASAAGTMHQRLKKLEAKAG